MPTPAFPGPYTDPNITVNGNSLTPVALTPTPPNTYTAAVLTYYNPAGWQNSGFSPQAALPQSPVSWLTGRSPYKVDGMVGQTFFNNPSF